MGKGERREGGGKAESEGEKETESEGGGTKTSAAKVCGKHTPHLSNPRRGCAENLPPLFSSCGQCLRPFLALI